MMSLLAVAVLAAPSLFLPIGLPVGASPEIAAGPPKDYTQTEGLTSPFFDDLMREATQVPMHDDVRLYVEVVRPAAGGRFPVILVASPYHGTLADRDGTSIFPEPRDENGRSLGLTGYFPPRGYAVVMADLRGSGRSGGCFDHLGPDDAKDLKTLVEWAADAPWSNGRVGMTGHGYAAATSIVASAQDPQGLATILPSAGLSSMYDHQFQHGVPYSFEWGGPILGYSVLATTRHLPPAPVDSFLGTLGDNFGNDMDSFGCGWRSSSLLAGEDQLSGRYAGWHAERDHQDGATAADIPIFLMHGVNDDVARVPAIEWFTQRDGRAGDKLWLGQWDHGSGCCPTPRGMQAALAMHAWFDKHLAQRDVDTGPPVEIFLSDGTFQEATSGDRDQIYTADAWPGTPANLGLYPGPDGSLGTGEAAEGELTFVGVPTGIVDPQGTGGIEFVAEPLGQDTLLLGQPYLSLSASVGTPRLHLIANVYDEAPDGDRRRVAQCAMNPELRHGIRTSQLVVPGERYDLEPLCFVAAHNLRADHRLVLRITVSDPDKVPTFALDPAVTVFTGPGATALRLAMVDAPTLYDDNLPLDRGGVPTGPAQGSTSGTVMPLAPGAGVRMEDVTSAAFGFEVVEGFDNARMVATTTPHVPADVDLYLQRINPDGSLSDDLAAAESSDIEIETLDTGRLEAGNYRIEVHNRLGPPAASVDVSIAFFNQNGDPGV